MAVVVVANAIVWAAGSSLVVSNVACALSFGFFVASLSPGSLLGFALTPRDWGDVFRRELLGTGPVEGREYTRAAARSLAVLSACILLELCLGLTRRGVSARSFTIEISMLTGLESGFVAGYLMVTRRSPSSRDQ